MTICRLIVIALAASLLVASCGRKADNKPPPPPIKVGVNLVDSGEIEQALRVSGALQFISNTTVSAEVSAQVKSIEVTDGQAVEEGQTLLVFDDTKIKELANHAAHNLQKNEATLTFNRIEWQKNLELLKSGVVSQTHFDQKLSAYQNSVGQVEADKALLAKAQEDLRKTKVLAPISGRLSKRFVEKGDWIQEGGKLFMISDYGKIYLEA